MQGAWQGRAWRASGTGKGQCSCRVGRGGGSVTCSRIHMHLFINSPFTQPGQVPGSEYLHTHTHAHPVPRPSTQGPWRACPPETQSWTSRAGTGRLWHRRSRPCVGSMRSSSLAVSGRATGLLLAPRAVPGHGVHGRVSGGSSTSHSPFQKDLHKLPEAAGIVIPHSFGVAEGLQEGCGLQDLDPQKRRVLFWPPRARSMAGATPGFPRHRPPQTPRL